MLEMLLFAFMGLVMLTTGLFEIVRSQKRKTND